MTLRVLLDATAIPARRVGVGRYVTELVATISRNPGDVDLHVLVKASDVDDLRARAPNVRFHTAAVRSRGVRIAWERGMLPVRVHRIRPDVFHGPHYTLPPALPCRSVVTFHDPTFFTHPELHEPAKVTFFRRAARRGVDRATLIVADSEYARRGAIEHVDADPEAVRVVPLGVDGTRYRPEPSETDGATRARLGIDGPYVLWVGAVEPRKDLPTLVGAYADLVRQGAEVRLVLAGPPAWGTRKALDAIRGSGVADRIVRPGYVTEEEQAALYRGAAAFAYPSIAEGFGLPVLEAMACGTPVVTTTGSAPEEIAAGACELVPPREPRAVAEMLGRILDDPDHARSLRARGLERAQQFPWERTAHETAAAWRQAAEDLLL